LGTFKLDQCVVYSSCEPCPMCLSALYWAGVKRIYYGNTKEDADRINFSDKFIYQQLDKPPVERAIPCIHVNSKRAIKAFEMWVDKNDKITY
ncbi:deaminase, partial [uncultured Muribaculum sp.]